jgi:GAF domain-containing protein
MTRPGGPPAAPDRAVDNSIFHVRALEAVRLVGDAAVAFRAVPEEGNLVVVAAYHRDPNLLEAAKATVGQRWNFGDALPGRVWEAGRGILIPEVDLEAMESVLHGAALAYLRTIGISSIMIVPLWSGGRVVGTLGVSRDPGNPPFQENDFELLGELADLPQLTNQ